MEIIEVNDQFLITGYRNLIDTDCVSWIVARISGTFQRVVNDRTTTWPKKKKKKEEDKNEIEDVLELILLSMTQVFIDNHYSTEYMEFVFELRREVRSDVIIAVMKVVVKVRPVHCTGIA